LSDNDFCHIALGSGAPAQNDQNARVFQTRRNQSTHSRSNCPAQAAAYFTSYVVISRKYTQKLIKKVQSVAMPSYQ
jgi:hypothetical protein